MCTYKIIRNPNPIISSTVSVYFPNLFILHESIQICASTSPSKISEKLRACVEYYSAQEKEERGQATDGCLSWHFQSTLLKDLTKHYAHSIAKFHQPQDSSFLVITLAGLTLQAKHPLWSLLNRRKWHRSQNQILKSCTVPQLLQTIHHIYFLPHF